MRLTGQQKFNAIFDRVGGWGSVPRTDDWRRPFKYMGPIAYGRKRQRAEPEIADIAVILVHETEKAWLLHHEGKEFWFPKSCGELEIDDFTGWAVLTAEMYWLRQKGVAPNDLQHDRLHQDALRSYHGTGLRLLVC